MTRRRGVWRSGKGLRAKRTPPKFCEREADKPKPLLFKAGAFGAEEGAEDKAGDKAGGVGKEGNSA